MAFRMLIYGVLVSSLRQAIIGKVYVYLLRATSGAIPSSHIVTIDHSRAINKNLLELVAFFCSIRLYVLSEEIAYSGR
jgi:hypothetical protein